MEEDSIINEKEENDNLQLVENQNVDEYEDIEKTYKNKREMLEKTKIVKQTWSIIEIVQKLKNNKLILDPDYQRNIIWGKDKKTAFIESLYMGIIIPPIYVVEIPNEDILSGNTYEVVDGKQRLTTILEFVDNNLILKGKNLEYYADIFSEQIFSQINEKYPKQTTEMLSSVLDIYVITANSPEFTKYDIFSRLNKGSEKLKANEIRKAIYHSTLTKIIDEFVESKKDEDMYKDVFSDNDRKRYEDYGRFYKSIAFYIRSNIELNKVENYNSRPREMINDVLHDFQVKEMVLDSEVVDKILTKTLELLNLLKDENNKEYIIDACVPFVVEKWDKLIEKLDEIKSDDIIKSTLDKSVATTNNVNKRLERISEILKNE